MLARIHSIETMGSVDGPGLRYIVFLQGCSMKCIYCHNRDTWDKSSGREVESKEIVSKIDSLKGFYRGNNGGVTCTGGEPLLQSEFVLKVFKETHNLQLTTALDTCGNVVLSDSVKAVLDETDFLLLDIKSLNDEKHKKITGVNRKIVKKFIEYVKDAKINTWLRYVYVPGYTDSQEDKENLINFINDFSSAERIDILPYHDLGRSKWEAMNLEYPLGNLEPPEKAVVEEFRKSIREGTSVIVK